MITSTIGRIFLDAYNEKMETDYDAITFFNEVYHPLFFGSNKYLQWVQNSPFVQMSKGQKVKLPRRTALTELAAKITVVNSVTKKRWLLIKMMKK